MIIVLLGPPGSGKGTQAELICKKFGFFHFSTGNILRNEVKKKTKIGKEIELIINAGKLISDKTIIKIVDNQISKQLKLYKGFLFDGFPRNLSQAKAFDILLGKNNQSITSVIQLSVHEEEISKRIQKRKLEEKREDDNENVLKSRLDVYFDETKPLLDFYQKKNKLNKINGTQTINDVNDQINSHILNLKNA
ncbi:MAG: adenylate kinase [Alphaproteobacteria bacterium MarineAlpha6_Bin1]|nr:MAG: adenylate kinase [Alphaproteobacteria bacterium MarineAlpha6_Bin1]|tara:strand:+ start:278 stop:856 length:579 start_codon:yes stop_codon:yes gene_type:complete